MSAFAYYEVVRCVGDDPDYAEIVGLDGYVAGKGDFDDETVAVFFYDIERVWEVPDQLLVSLGYFDKDERAHATMARRRIAEENGRYLEPPPVWARHVDGRQVLFETIGDSGASVYRIGNSLFIKSEPASDLSELPGEEERLRWLADTGFPCPEVVDACQHAGKHWLLMSALPGEDLVQAPGMTGAAAATIVARALQTLHGLDASTCPFDHRAEGRVAAARQRLGAGLHDHPDPAADDAEYATLFSTRPAHEDLVVTHGDACLPNFIVRDGRFTGVIDCGRLGVADRYQDLALACRSLARNYGRAHVPALLEAYGLDAVDEQKLAWYCLLDEFF